MGFWKRRKAEPVVNIHNFEPIDKESFESMIAAMKSISDAVNEASKKSVKGMDALRIEVRKNQSRK